MDPNTYSLYFHFPFCQKKCPYCHFYVIPPKDLHKKILLEALSEEWKLHLPKFQSKRLVSIYFGGGTPSLFPEGIETVLNWILKSPITLDPNVEITVEANPEFLDKEKFLSLKKAGVNRVSLGAQSFHEKDLQMLQRDHSPLEIEKAFSTLLTTGFSNISLDLMYDIPGQTRSSFQTSLQRCLMLPFTHLSLYNLTIEPHTSFYKKKVALEKKRPSSKQSLHMLEDAIHFLQEKGFTRYEISAFCKDGLISKHNMGYWLGRDFIGLGPSSSSFWKGERSKNQSSLLRYHQNLKQKKDFLEEKEKLPFLSLQKELFCLQLRLIKGALKSCFEKLLEEKSFLLKIKELKEQGLVQETTTHIALSKKGLLFHDFVASELI